MKEKEKRYKVMMVCIVLIVVSCMEKKDEKTPETATSLSADSCEAERSSRGKEVSEIAKKVNRILNSVEEFHLFARAASDHATAEDFIIARKEFRFLIECSNVSLPIIFELLDREHKADSIFLTICFLVFAETGEPETIPYLVDYLRSLSEDKKAAARGVLHPFNYAVYAIRKITGSDAPFVAAYDVHFFDKRFEIADKAEKWYVEYLNAPLSEKERAIRIALRRLTTDSFWFDITHYQDKGRWIYRSLPEKQKRKLLLKKKEVQLLIKESEVSLPLIYERMEKKGPSSIYLLILGETKKAESVPYLVEYLKRLPDEESKMSKWEWRRFRYALEALQKITKIDIPLDKSDKELYRLRNEIITEAERWYNQHSPDD